MSKNKLGNIAIKHQELKIKLVDSIQLQSLVESVNLDKLKFHLERFKADFENGSGILTLRFEVVRTKESADVS